MRRLFASILVLLFLFTSSFASSIDTMNKYEAMNALSDKTITTLSVSTLNGKLIANKFTGYFGKKGELVGFFARKPDGALKYDKGGWALNSDGKVCLRWKQWFDGKEHCVFLYKLSNGFCRIFL